jgi:hypothetical protein
MNNDTDSMVKRSLLLTVKLVGAFALWVTVVSLVMTTLTARMLGALSGESSAAASEQPAKTKDQPGAPRVTPKGAAGANAKSNG